MMRELMLGPPLNAREDTDLTLLQLNQRVAEIPQMLRDGPGERQATEQAAREIDYIAALPNGSAEAMCKRAMLLFALRTEEAMQAQFDGDPMATDLVERVLPFLTPPFLRHSCQQPDHFVLGCVIMSEMWRGERLGNWPLAHQNKTIWELNHRADRER